MDDGRQVMAIPHMTLGSGELKELILAAMFVGRMEPNEEAL